MAHPEPRVADSLASTNREFCCDAGSLVGTLRLRSSPRRGSCNFRYHSRTSNGRLNGSYLHSLLAFWFVASCELRPPKHLCCNTAKLSER